MGENFENIGKYIDESDYEKALSLLNAATSVKDTEAEAYRMLGYVYYQMGNFDRAVQNSTKALAFGTLGFMESYMAHYFRGRAAAASADYDLAISDCWSLLKFAKSDSDILENAYEVIELVMETDMPNLCTETKFKLVEILIELQKVIAPNAVGQPFLSEKLTELRLALGKQP